MKRPTAPSTTAWSESVDQNFLIPPETLAKRRGLEVEDLVDIATNDQPRNDKACSAFMLSSFVG
jgi:hypothetical protein